MDFNELIKISILTVISFGVAVCTTPILTTFLYKNRLGKSIRSDGSTPVYTGLHKKKEGTPTMGGILVWGTTLVLGLLFWALDRVFHISYYYLPGSEFPLFHGLNFLTRNETLLPLGALLGAALVGLIDDFLDVRKRGKLGAGMRFRFKVIFYAVVAFIGSLWFYYKLGFSTINIPLLGDLNLGVWYIPFFIVAVIGISFAVNLSDGLDGLAGGTLLISLVAYTLICFIEGRLNMAAMLAVVCGALLAFLWFNIHPARFFMGDTGAMALGVLLAVVAFLTDTVFLLPFIGIVFVLEAGSIFIQLLSRKLLGKKILLSSPLHHHLEALGWPETKVTMRLWIISFIGAIIGLVIFFINRTV